MISFDSSKEALRQIHKTREKGERKKKERKKKNRRRANKKRKRKKKKIDGVCEEDDSQLKIHIQRKELKKSF